MPEPLRIVQAPPRAPRASLRHRLPLRNREIAPFLGLWLLVGYALGTGTLVGPVRWVVERTRDAARPGMEKLAVLAVIAAFVLVSLVVAIALTRAVCRTAQRHLRILMPLVALFFAGGALHLWLTPGALGAEAAEDTAAGSPFTFGPYPTAERLRTLKAEGYTAVVSLLHPAVAPFEPKLLGDEREAAAAAGIELVHLPMLPWLSDNRVALEGIRELARKPGRYYVHCYLGMDRVQLVRRVVAQTLGDTAGRALTEARAMPTVFERGAVTTLDRDVFVTPFPLDEEMGSLSRGRARTVVSLLDPKNPDDAPWIERARRVFATYELELRSEPVPIEPFDAQRALQAVRNVRALPRPLVAITFLPLDSGRAPAAEAFLQAWRTDFPPLPPSLWPEPFEAGPAAPITVHVSAGPTPTPAEMRALQRRGVRRVLYLGDPATAPVALHGWAAREAGLSWEWWNARRPAHLLETLNADGPWYIYGPRLAEVKDEVVQRFGGPRPDRVIPRPEPRGSLRDRVVRFVRAGVPTFPHVILLGPPLLLVALAAALLAGHLRQKRDVRVPYTRKIFHFVIFTTSGVLQMVGGLSAVCLFGGIVAVLVLYAVWRGPGFGLYDALARPTDAPRQSMFVLVPLATTALGGILANVFFAPFAPIGYLVGGWGDAVGEPVGSRWGRMKYRVPSLFGVPAQRSLEGSAAVLVMGTLAATLGLVLLGQPMAVALYVGCLCGAAGAVVEAGSNHGLDNLTTQVAGAAVAFYLS